MYNVVSVGVFVCMFCCFVICVGGLVCICWLVFVFGVVLCVVLY